MQKTQVNVFQRKYFQNVGIIQFPVHMAKNNNFYLHNIFDLIYSTNI